MGSGSLSDRLACTVCGVELPGTAKFCLECAAPVSGAPARESRRTVTLLFTDVTGSTEMGEALDPEAYRRVMGQYFAIARAAVERHGGVVEKFVGDAVLAVFGAQEVHEDDALRAVRAAYEMKSDVAMLSDQLLAELGVRLAIRTGVNTGAVVTGSARAGGSFATGDAVNTAARLEQGAPPSEILLGATTYALVRDAVEAEAAEPVVAKGKAEPVSAYRLLRVLEVPRGRHWRTDVALVGRARESLTLDEAFIRTATSGRGHVVTVLGPAGIGKSRLVADFVARVGDRGNVAQGRCLSYGQGITYWPLVQAMRGALGLSGTESPEVTRHVLTEALGPATDGNELVEPLMAMLGKAGTPGGEEQTFWCVRRLVAELASHRPLVLILGDLHWAESTLVDLLQRMGREISDLPVLLLCDARPELLELHPHWGSEVVVGSTTLRLEPLSPVETSASVTSLLGGDSPAGLAEAVANWSGGNPLFIEEIVAHLVESAILARDPADGWRVTRPLDQVEAPPTVTALLAARLDRLPADERDLLERVSVVGLEFDNADVELMLEPPSRPQAARLLEALARRDFIHRGPSLQGGTWVFQHVLVRDAVYEGMAKSLRSGLHERFADALLAGDDAGDERVGFAAHHMEQAARYRREFAGRDGETEALVDRAVESLILAAGHARDRQLEDVSISYLVRAMALGPASDAVRRNILARQVVSCFDANQMDLLDETLHQLEGELDDVHNDDVDRAFLRTMRGVHEMSIGGAVDPARVSASAQDLVALGRANGDALAIVRGLRAQSTCSAVLALWKDAETHASEIIDIGSPSDARYARALHIVALTVGDGTLREVRDCVRAEEALDGHTPAFQLVSLLWDALVATAECSPRAAELVAANAALCDQLYANGAVSQPISPLLVDAYAMNRDLDSAIAYGQRVNDTFRQSGALGNASTYTLQQALLMLERGDSSQSVVPLVVEAEGYTSPYDALSVSCGAACRAILSARSGDHDLAHRLLQEGLRVADRTHQTWQRADLRRVLCVVPRATGDQALERRMLEEAAAMYARKQIRSYDAEIQRRLTELRPAGT